MNTQPILLVEDSPDDEALTVRAFQRNKIQNEVIVVRDGAEALEWLFCTGKFASRNPAVVPAVVLLDLKLPKVDGLEVLKRIRADPRMKLLPVVVLTSSRETPDLIEFYKHGVNAYVVKPVDFSEFMKAVRQVGVFWAAVNEPPPDIGGETTSIQNSD